MQTLREKLFQSSRFLIGTELVSVRGGMAERSAVKTRDFANELIACDDIDWISITDNAGGHPQLAPTALGKPILYAGKEVVIHLTCKDLNRNGLESEAWLLNSEGFHNILAMTGDYPVAGDEGLAKPVFDIDSVGLISMLNKMNHGLDPKGADGTGKHQRLERVAQIFRQGRLPGIVVTPRLLELCLKHGQSADGGKAFFLEFAVAGDGAAFSVRPLRQIAPCARASRTKRSPRPASPPCARE